MSRKNIRNALALLLATMVLGCAGETALERNWGRSFESAKHMQMLNPDAGKNLEPVAGLVGPAEEVAMEGYIKGWSEPNKGWRSSGSSGKRSTISAIEIKP